MTRLTHNQAEDLTFVQTLDCFEIVGTITNPFPRGLKLLVGSGYYTMEEEINICVNPKGMVTTVFSKIK